MGETNLGSSVSISSGSALTPFFSQLSFDGFLVYPGGDRGLYERAILAAQKDLLRPELLFPTQAEAIGVLDQSDTRTSPWTDNVARSTRAARSPKHRGCKCIHLGGIHCEA